MISPIAYYATLAKSTNVEEEKEEEARENIMLYSLKRKKKKLRVILPTRVRANRCTISQNIGAKVSKILDTLVTIIVTKITG